MRRGCMNNNRPRKQAAPWGGFFCNIGNLAPPLCSHQYAYTKNLFLCHCTKLRRRRSEDNGKAKTAITSVKFKPISWENQ